MYQGNNSDTNIQGLRLNILWECSIKWPANNKNEYQWMQHHLSIPYYVVAGMSDVDLMFYHNTFVRELSKGVPEYKAMEIAQEKLHAKE